MMHYADAYEKKIRTIFSETKGSHTTSIPVTQYRDAPLYYWNQRQIDMLAYSRKVQPKLVLFGNSILHFWGGHPTGPNHGATSWNEYFGSEPVVNMGMGWDRIENVLWRVYHGALDGIAPEKIVLMIGTNNIGLNSDEEILEGIRHLMKALIARQPNSKILLVGILPRRGMEKKVAQPRLSSHSQRI